MNTFFFEKKRICGAIYIYIYKIIGWFFCRFQIKSASAWIVRARYCSLSLFSSVQSWSEPLIIQIKCFGLHGISALRLIALASFQRSSEFFYPSTSRREKALGNFIKSSIVICFTPKWWKDFSKGFSCGIKSSRKMSKHSCSTWIHCFCCYSVGSLHLWAPASSHGALLPPLLFSNNKKEEIVWFSALPSPPPDVTRCCFRSTFFFHLFCQAFFSSLFLFLF